MIEKLKCGGVVTILLSALILIALAGGSEREGFHAQAISCGKKLQWQSPELAAGTAQTYSCQYTKPDGTHDTMTCHNFYWHIPAHEKCVAGSGELCKCCRICKLEASYVQGICNASGCQPGPAAIPPPNIMVYYYPARLYLCEGGTPPDCDEGVAHAKCIEFEPDDPTNPDCGW